MALPPFQAHVDVWAILGSVLAGYLIACRRHDARTGQPTPARAKHLFLLGMAILWVASDWPMHELSDDYLFSAHMLEHLLYMLVAAPLLVAGVPAWMWRRLLRPRGVRAVWHFLTRPVVALAFFNGVLLFVHWPAIVEAQVTSEAAHFWLHALMLFAALVMWWPIVSPLPEMPPLNPPAQMLYLFLQSLAPTIPASFLTFGRTLLYPAYAADPRIWGIGPLTDQLVAGLIMKLLGSAILWVVIGSVFFQWANRERKQDWDELRWRDVDAEIRAELRR
ncbi:MAG: cytochrome c oxidase assembly protein [Planctomycetaceae bacterium]